MPSTLFDDMEFAMRSANLHGAIVLTPEQHEAIMLGRPIELLITAVVTTRSFTRKKDAVVERVTLMPISSEVQHIGTDVVAVPEAEDDE